MAMQHVNERPIGALVADAAGQLSTLMRKEVELARVEVKRDVAAAAVGTAGFGVAAALALVAALVLSAAAVLGLGTWIPMWLAALLVGGAEATVAGLAALAGRRAVRAVQPPERVLRTLKADVECLRHPSS